MPRRTFRLGLLSFLLLLAALWYAAVHFGVVRKIGGDPYSFVLSFAMLFAPFWAFGLGAAPAIKRALRSPMQRLLAPLVLLASYLVFVLPRGEFTWSMAAVLTLVPLGSVALFELRPLAESAQLHWQDVLVLATLGSLVSFRLLDAAWPHPGLRGLPKLLLVDLVLYLYLVIRPMPRIGYDFRTQWRDWVVGIREFLLLAPIMILLGFALGFLRWNPHATPALFGSSWLIIFLFTAIPEELYFRGLIQNGLSHRLAPHTALVATSVLFGLYHFNKGAVFNWRYVIMASIAGYFYGRAWSDRHRLFAAGITHATIDAVWALWFR